MTKKELRSYYLEKRHSLSQHEREQMSVEIFVKVMENFELKHKLISIFLSIEKFREINTKPFLALDAQFCLPVVDFEAGVLKHVLFEGGDQIKVNDWGIPEPIYGLETNATDIDFVIVPLLAYDKRGFRVGYGKGFYDRFLADCKPECQFIGLSFFEPEDEISDTFEGDIPLDYCVTPYKIYDFGE